MKDLVKWIQTNHPYLVKQMKECSHHYDTNNLNPFHLEDDVFTHTMLVCNQVHPNDTYVQVAALFHDIGKVDTRKLNHEKKRVSFYGHEGVSAFKSIGYLKELGYNKNEIINIFQLIALHTEPFKTEHSELRSRLRHQPELQRQLSMLSTADNAGRFSDIEDREQFQPQVYDKMYTPRDEDELNQRVTVMIGLPCSGKSTFIDNELFEYNYLSRDQILIENSNGEDYNEQWKNADHKLIDSLVVQKRNELIKSGQDFTIDMTNMSRKSRRKHLNCLPKTYKKIAVVCLTSYEEMIRRNDARPGKKLDIDVLNTMMQAFYPPLYDEFDEIIWNLN